MTGLDLTGTQPAGEIYGEVKIEKLLALDVDLVVTAFGPRRDGP